MIPNLSPVGSRSGHEGRSNRTKLEWLSEDREAFDVVDFIVFIVLFLGGFYLFGIAFDVPTAQGVVFSGGIILVSLALAYAMRQRGSATRRTDSWDQRGDK